MRLAPPRRCLWTEPHALLFHRLSAALVESCLQGAMKDEDVNKPFLVGRSRKRQILKQVRTHLSTWRACEIASFCNDTKSKTFEVKYARSACRKHAVRIQYECLSVFFLSVVCRSFFRLKVQEVHWQLFANLWAYRYILGKRTTQGMKT